MLKFNLSEFVDIRVERWYARYRKGVTDRRLLLIFMLVKNNRHVLSGQRAVIFVSCYFYQSNSQD